MIFYNKMIPYPANEYHARRPRAEKDDLVLPDYGTALVQFWDLNRCIIGLRDQILVVVEVEGRAIILLKVITADLHHGLEFTRRLVVPLFEGRGDLGLLDDEALASWVCQRSSESEMKSLKENQQIAK